MTSSPTSTLDILAGLPCVNSLKMAQTIIDELRGRGIYLASVPPEFPLDDGPERRAIVGEPPLSFVDQWPGMMSEL